MNYIKKNKFFGSNIVSSKDEKKKTFQFEIMAKLREKQDVVALTKMEYTVECSHFFLGKI